MPAPTMNSIVPALRLFVTSTLDRPDLACGMVRVAHPRNRAVLLGREAAIRMLSAPSCLTHQAALPAVYRAGRVPTRHQASLRRAEACQ